MTTEERRALLDRAIPTYGAPAQIDMAVEEINAGDSGYKMKSSTAARSQTMLRTPSRP